MTVVARAFNERQEIATLSQTFISMSRSLSSAQVIGLGEYLNPDFDPSSLTVSQLLGVLGFHNIRYPTPYTKPKLVQLFLDEITSKSVKLKRERLKKDNSLASDDGITDGITGKPISKEKRVSAHLFNNTNHLITVVQQPIRRSLRRSSRVNSEDEEALSQPDPVSRLKLAPRTILTCCHAAQTPSLFCCTGPW